LEGGRGGRALFPLFPFPFSFPFPFHGGLRQGRGFLGRSYGPGVLLDTYEERLPARPLVQVGPRSRGGEVDGVKPLLDAVGGEGNGYVRQHLRRPEGGEGREEVGGGGQ
jgi:hypothetical protein